MYVKNSNFAIYLVLAALVGFGVSFLFHSSDAQSSLVSGDISKATRYSNLKEDPEMSMIEEKLRNDTTYFNQTNTIYKLLDCRVSDLEDLTSRTIDLCSDIPEFKTAIRNVVSLNAKASNTKQYIALASSCLNRISAGKQAPEYEQASSNAIVGFQKIKYQLAIGKAFVDEAALYLAGKDGEEYSPIADLVTEWSVYCMQDAMLNNSETDVAYWNNKYSQIASSSASVNKSYKQYAEKMGLGLDAENLYGLDAENLYGLDAENLFGLDAVNLYGLDAENKFGLDANNNIQ